MICQSCNGYFLWPAMYVDYDDSTWTAKRYERWEKDLNVGRAVVPRLLQDISKRLGKKPQNVLEIGCGSGYMGVVFKELGIDYQGVDVDSQLIHFGKERGVNLHLVAAEQLLDSPLSDQRFDLIISSNTFEHLQNPVKGFEAVKSLCSGICVIITPNAKGMSHVLKSKGLVRKIMSKLQGRDIDDIPAHSLDGTWHNIAYTRDAFRYFCERAGLEIDELRTVGTNDLAYGFVQRNNSLSYKLLSIPPAMINMRSQLLLICKP